MWKVSEVLLMPNYPHFLEAMDILFGEQNDFRKGRPCMDHVYALSATWIV